MTTENKPEETRKTAQDKQNVPEVDVRNERPTGGCCGPENGLPAGGWRGGESEIPKGGWRC